MTVVPERSASKRSCWRNSHPVAHSRRNRVRTRFRDPLRIELDADATCGAEIPDGGDWYAPITGAKVEHHVTRSRPSRWPASAHHLRRRRDVDDVERLGCREMRGQSGGCESGRYACHRQREESAEHRARTFHRRHDRPPQLAKLTWRHHALPEGGSRGDQNARCPTLSFVVTDEAIASPHHGPVAGRNGVRRQQTVRHRVRLHRVPDSAAPIQRRRERETGERPRQPMASVKRANHRRQDE